MSSGNVKYMTKRNVPGGFLGDKGIITPDGSRKQNRKGTI